MNESKTSQRGLTISQMLEVIDSTDYVKNDMSVVMKFKYDKNSLFLTKIESIEDTRRGRTITNGFFVSELQNFLKKYGDIPVYVGPRGCAWNKLKNMDYADLYNPVRFVLVSEDYGVIDVGDGYTEWDRT